MSEVLSSTSSRHFSTSEFACSHCGVALVRPVLLARLEALRAAIGKPLPIIDGYRCPPHNRAVGGAENSQHMYGAAVDIGEGLVTLDQAQRVGFTGIGTKGRWAVHVDVRDGKPVRWIY